MASQRYSEIRTLHEENRHGNGGYDISYKPRLSVPIRHSTNDFNYSANEQGAQERIRHQETAVQWVSDPVSGRERFRVNVNIDGFHQNEVCHCQQFFVKEFCFFKTMIRSMPVLMVINFLCMANTSKIQIK